LYFKRRKTLAIDYKTEISAIDENHRSVEFTVPALEMQKLFDKNISEFRKQVSMKGFRPGHVPKQLFVSRFGDEVYRETVERIVQNDLKNEFEKIVETWKTDEKLEIAAPAEPGDLQCEREQDLVYKLSIALNKPLAVEGYKELGISVPAVVVSEEEVNEVIQGARKRLDELGKPAPEYDAEFKARLTDDILKDKQQHARQIALKEAFDKLIEKNPFPVLEEQIKYTAERSGQQLDAMRNEINRAIQEERILRAIIEQESLKPTQAQVDARIQEIADSAKMDFASVKDAMRKNGQIVRLRETLKLELAQNILIGGVLPEKEST
jgi:FKBP-type peptidyl-prolyl cis-trans isomerase (trigger factor)